MHDLTVYFKLWWKVENCSEHYYVAWRACVNTAVFSGNSTNHSMHIFSVASATATLLSCIFVGVKKILSQMQANVLKYCLKIVFHIYLLKCLEHSICHHLFLINDAHSFDLVHQTETSLRIVFAISNTGSISLSRV